MIIQVLQTLFSRNLNGLKNELALYKNETVIWAVAPGIVNSAGNLCLHLVGNLNTYIGAELGKTGYVRDREADLPPRPNQLPPTDAGFVVVDKDRSYRLEDGTAICTILLNIWPCLTLR